MYVKRAQQYVDDVLSGKKPACKWVRLACERHNRDLANNWIYEYNHELANRACHFIELLPHIEGTWKPPNITLEPWQPVFHGLSGWEGQCQLTRCHILLVAIREGLVFAPPWPTSFPQVLLFVKVTPQILTSFPREALCIAIRC